MSDSPDSTIPCGVKHDDNKARYDLLPPEAIASLVDIRTYGAKKYGDRNWERGINYSRLVAALLRHLSAWLLGERLDQESHLPHLAHAFCTLAFLLTLEKRYSAGSLDDLPYASKRRVNP